MLMPSHKPQPVVDPETKMHGRCRQCKNMVYCTYGDTRPGEFEGTRVAECPLCKKFSQQQASPSVWVTEVDHVIG